MLKVKLKPGREVSILRRHPWIFSGALQNSPKDIDYSQLVEVQSSSGDFLAQGFWNDGSIAIKILSFEKVLIDQDFWVNTFRNALILRSKLSLIDSEQVTAFRLLHAEGDGVPGLIIDIYGSSAVIQVQAKALTAHRDHLVLALREVLDSRISAIYWKSKDESGDESKQVELVWGERSDVIIQEYGAKYFVDIEGGQKTGFFIDQRENRKLLRKFVRDKKVLNAFSYTGGFSISSLIGGAKSVASIEISKPAVELLEKNISLNNFSDKHQSITSDYFNYMQEEKHSYEVIVLDPPAFAKHRKALEAGYKGYVKINQLAFERLDEQGMLMTYSCSQLLSRDDFRKAVLEAALKARREVQVIYELHQAPCHPVNLFHYEGEYLKGFVLVAR